MAAEGAECLMWPPCLAQASGEYPVKDSAQSMHSAQGGRSASDGKNSGGLAGAGSGNGSTLRSVLDTMSSGKRMTGQVRSFVMCLILIPPFADAWASA
jgi:hypothetical protein